MKWRKWLENWDMTKLQISAPFLEMEWEPREPDREAAWDLYVEMVTRIVIQPSPDSQGDEEAALNSVYSLFQTTREIMRQRGRGCSDFSKIATVVLNQLVRPFTAKWHKLSRAGAFANEEQCKVFRAELERLQVDLRHYAGMLAEMAQVADLTSLEGKAASGSAPARP